MNNSLINNSLTNSSIIKKDTNDNNEILDLLLELIRNNYFDILYSTNYLYIGIFINLLFTKEENNYMGIV